MPVVNSGVWGAVMGACNPRWLRQKSCCEFEASLGYIIKHNKKKIIKERKNGKMGWRCVGGKKGGKEGRKGGREGKAVQS